MSKFDEALVKYASNMKEKLSISSVDEALLRGVTKSLGPSIYNEDANTVSCSDKEELDRIKKNFLVKKLGMQDGPELDKAIEEVCQQMGSSNRNKYRAVFYYLLAEKFKMRDRFVS